MNQCLRISMFLKFSKAFLQDIVQKNAKTLGIEGTVQVISNEQIKIIACGTQEAINRFLDILHAEAIRQSAEQVEVEPFLKEKDYRGVFRIIE